MRWAIGFLVVINVSIFLWGSLTQDSGAGDRRSHAAPKLPSLEILPPLGDRMAPPPAPAGLPSVGKASLVPALSEVESGGELDLPSAADAEISEVAAAEPLPITNDASPAASKAKEFATDALILETDLDPPSISGPTESTADSMSLALYCGRLGPIPEIAAAEAAKDRLNNVGLRPVIQEVVEPKNKGFWVLIPPLTGRAEGNRMVAQLQAEGVKDMWLFRRGELNNAISLGLYNRRTNAEARAKQLKALGFQVEVWPRMEPASHYHVSYSGTTSGVFDQVRDLVPEFDNSDTACARVAAVK